MKRYTFIKDICDLLSDKDVVIFTGPELCREAYKFHKTNFYYFDEYFGLSTSFGLGIAMCTDKRVFIFVGDGDLLREFASIPQMAASQCSNLFLFVLDNNGYQSVGNMPNIFDKLLSKRGVFFNSGFKVLDLTKDFNERDSRYLVDMMERMSGPFSILISIERGIKKDLEDSTNDYNAFREFVKNKEIGTALYTPPAFIAAENVKTLKVN